MGPRATQFGVGLALPVILCSVVCSVEASAESRAEPGAEVRAEVRTEPGAAPMPGSDDPNLAGLREPGGETVEWTEPEEGEALLLHFFASWCPSCAGDLRALQQAATHCRAGRFRIFIVNVGEERRTAEEFVAALGVDLPLLLDGHGATWRKLGGTALPTNLFWSRAGRRVATGPLDTEDWRIELGRLGCDTASGAQ